MATKYSNSKYSYYWFARDTKTAVVVYNISNIDNLTIDKYYVVDGENIKSRMIGKYLYTLSKVNFSFPYRTYYSE
jgi:hypothetical protein